MINDLLLLILVIYLSRINNNKELFLIFMIIIALKS